VAASRSLAAALGRANNASQRTFQMVSNSSTGEKLDRVTQAEEGEQGHRGEQRTGRRALRGDSRIQRGRPAPHIDISDQPLPVLARSTLPRPACRTAPGRFGSSLTATTRRSRQGGAPHPTNDLDGDKHRHTLPGAETALLTTKGSHYEVRRMGAESGIVAGAFVACTLPIACSIACSPARPSHAEWILGLST
jgi:hypothetical protein